MRTIIISEIVDDPERAEQIVNAIKSLRNRAASVQGTMEDFAEGLGAMLGISGAEVLAGLDTKAGTVDVGNNEG